MLEALPGQISFPQLEEEQLSFWDAQKIFAKSLELRKDAKPFVFYDGPPFATGLPHYGHLLAGTIKDVIPRYQTMRGRYVERRFGWDCHGLPIEMEIQKELDLKSNGAIEEYGVAKFNEACRAGVLKYVDEWEKTVRRMGRWVDFQNDYKTMDLSFMESVWWVFAELYEKGLIYEGYKVLPYSWASGTVLSNFESNLNFKDVQDPAVTLKFPVDGEADTFLLAWTTTPWTLVSNLALCVHPTLRYVTVRDKADGKTYILGKSRLSHYFKEDGFELLSECAGSDLKGRRYLPLFEYAAKEVDAAKCFVVLNDEYVTDADGTGIVHQAPAYGEDDMRVCRAAGLPVFDALDLDGNFKPSIALFAGRNMKEADKDVLRNLKERGLLARHGQITHSYPFCWRTDTPLIYKAISTWFVKVEEIRDRMVAHNREIHWTPAHVGEGRFGNWLGGARDWAISRNRFWGTPIPIWRAEDGELWCFGSVAELEKASGRKVTDLHKHFLDDLVLEKNGKKFTRVKEVLDCWFESGSMPYAQNHYPFENKAKVEATFPADFIAEGLDQTRGWFYTLVVLSAALFDKKPFQNVVVNGLILAEDGKKMSKRLKNYPDPKFVLDQYGADALRLYLISSTVVKGESLRFTETGVKEIVKGVLLPLWNAASFFTSYARIDGWDPSKAPTRLLAKDVAHPLDRWVLSASERLVAEVSAAMDDYDLQKAVPPVLSFIESLTNWYIRLSRRRFWSDENPADKAQATVVLHHVLLTTAKVLAPFAPFLSERLWRHLRTPGSPESVHLADFPVADGSLRDLELEAEMAIVEKTVSLGRNLRLANQLRVRQPLAKLTVVTGRPGALDLLRRHEQLLAEELNVKKVEFSADEGAFVSLSLKPNFKVLGKKVGPKMKAVGEAMANLPASEIALAEKNGTLTVRVDGAEIVCVAEDFVVQRQKKEGAVAGSEDGLTVLLDSTLSPELVAEGLARDFVNLVQKRRKDLDLAYTDRIAVTFQGSSAAAKAVLRFADYVKGETLALRLSEGAADGEPEELDGAECRIHVDKITAP